MSTQSPVDCSPPISVPNLPPLPPANADITESALEPLPGSEFSLLANGNDISNNGLDFHTANEPVELENCTATNPNPTKTDNSLGIACTEDNEIGDADEVTFGGGDWMKELPCDGGLEGQKTPFPSAIPKQRNFPNQNYESYELGYDSDGELMEFDDYAEKCEDVDDYDEVELKAASFSALSIVDKAAALSEVTTVQDVPTLTEEKIKGMNVNQLKAELEKRGKAKSGNKTVLQERLKTVMDAPVSNTPICRPESMNGLDVTATWVLLNPNPMPIPNPDNPDSNLRPPTERDGSLNPKYGYDEQFDRLPFEGTTKNMTYIFESRKKLKKSAGQKKLSERSLSPVRNARRMKSDQEIREDPTVIF